LLRYVAWRLLARTPTVAADLDRLKLDDVETWI